MKIILGKVDWYNLNGYGVLIVNKEQVFVHKSNIYGGKSLEKGEIVILKEIQENKVRERKEAIGVLKIKEEHLLELENEYCDANLMLNLYSKILPEKKHEYIKRQVYLTKLINSPEDFSKITKYIDFLENDKVSEHESFLRLAKEYLFNIATDYYKNIIWLNCYLEFKGSTENFVSAINSASIRLKQDSPTNWCKDFTLDFNLILTNFFDLSTTKILVHLFEKLPVQSKNTFEKEICKLFEEKDSIDILSSQFLFVKLYLSDDSKKIIFSNIITNENKITGLGDINTSLSIFKTHRDVPLLIDHILNNRYFKNELIKLPPYKLLQFIQPLSSDFKDKFILALMSEFKVTQPIDLLSEQFDFMLDHLSNESKAEITSYIINNWSLIKDSSDTETLIKISQRHKDLPTLIDYIFLSSSLNTQILELSKNGRLYSISQKFLQSAFQEFKGMEIIDFDSLLVEFLVKNKSLIDVELKVYISSNWSKVIDNTSNKTIITALNSFNFDENFKEYLYSISLDTDELYNELIKGRLNSFPIERLVNKLLNESEFRRKLSNIYSIGSRLNIILSQALIGAEERIISIGSDLEFELACELCEIVNRDDYNTYAHSIIRSLSEKCIGKYYFLLAHKFDLYQTKTLFINQLANFIGFPENNLKQLVPIFFPNSDEQYFTNHGNRNGWSSDFIFQRNNERYQQIINLLIKELQIVIEPLKEEKKTCFSATDLANYTYCPASYLSSRVFKLPKIKNESVLIGEEFHKKNHLIEYLQKFNATNYSSVKVQAKLDSLDEFARIKQSVLEYSGHSDDPKIFFSNNKKLCGIPDYIFIDKHSCRFAVEEKFTFKDKAKVINEFSNHRLQALTYLYGLSSLQFTNVYLIYWFLEKAENELGYKVKEVSLYNIIKNPDGKQELLDTFNRLELIENGGNIVVPANVPNYNKCIICDYFPVCRYKTGKENTLNLSR